MNSNEARAAKIIAQVRANATDVKFDGTLHGRRLHIETGRIASTIAGAKIHACRFTIYRWIADGNEDAAAAIQAELDAERADGASNDLIAEKLAELVALAGAEELSLYPACGTSRASGTGGTYQNYYGIQPAGTDPTCGKCAKAAAKNTNDES